jgi:NAD(P)H dehydrogenase (quinone)
MSTMAVIYVPFYSRYGAVEAMAQAVAEGVREAGSQAVLAYTGDVMTPPEIIAADPRWKATHERLLRDYPLASVEELGAADGVAFGSPTRFGNVAAQLKNFVDMMGGLWMSGACIGKPAGVFTSTASIHGGQETTLYTFWPVLAHLGFVLVGVPYSVQELLATTTGGTPYGPSHVAGGNSDRPVDDGELAICRAFGARLARIADALKAAH